MTNRASVDEEKARSRVDREKKMNGSKSVPVLKTLSHSRARDLEAGWDSQFAQSLSRNKLILRGIGEDEKELRSKLTRDRLQLGIQMKHMRRQRDKTAASTSSSLSSPPSSRKAMRRPKSAKALAVSLARASFLSPVYPASITALCPGETNEVSFFVCFHTIPSVENFLFSSGKKHKMN